MHRKTDEKARASLFRRRQDDDRSKDEESEETDDGTDLESGIRSKTTWLSGFLRRRAGRTALGVHLRPMERRGEGTDESSDADA